MESIDAHKTLLHCTTADTIRRTNKESQESLLRSVESMATGAADKDCPPGNLAGDCQEFRTRLLANGALLPLARLAMRGRFRSESATVLAAAQTAAWALCNLIKSVGPEVGGDSSTSSSN